MDAAAFEAVASATGGQVLKPLAEQLPAFIPSVGLTVRSRNSWDSGDAEGIRLAVAQTQASGVSVIVFITYEGDLAALLGEAEAAGLLRPEYVWLTVDAEVWVHLARNDTRLAAQLHGMLSFQATAAVSNGFARFQRAWASMRAADCARLTG